MNRREKEKIQQLAVNVFYTWSNTKNYEPIDEDMAYSLLPIIEKALIDFRNQALEEAAGAAEKSYPPDGHAPGDWPTPEECARNIRALKTESK